MTLKKHFVKPNTFSVNKLRGYCRGASVVRLILSDWVATSSVSNIDSRYKGRSDKILTKNRSEGRIVRDATHVPIIQCIARNCNCQPVIEQSGMT